MRLELTARHFSIPASTRKFAEDRLGRVLKPLNHSAVSAQVVVTKDKTHFHAEVTLHMKGEHFLHGEATGRDTKTALLAAIDKIDRQVQKLKGKWTEGKRRGVSPGKALALASVPAQRDDGAQQIRIIRARRYAVKPMSVDEAAMEVVDGHDTFLVFRNSATEEINVVFRRSDGHLGLIEPEA